ncbi:succinate dehydrogenase, hydrophobic membrane anchor protein [Sphingomonas sp.]|jgi:succinate dehydrogenase / fumarate reductase membrane anchor subunit|uniref:succinate dehydrogenase, hydrophobic membrane anchor protein n=1 Tax=Sphingomonas sp. TaxID=28214 RepID=UPI002ED96F41
MRSGTAIGRVRGLGSAKEGTHHWLNHRMTACSNLLLMTWLLIAVARLGHYDYAAVRAWLQSAWVAIPMLLLIVSVFYHFRLGLQVVIEDYQTDASRVILLFLLNFFTVTAAGIAIFSILKVAFGSAA